MVSTEWEETEEFRNRIIQGDALAVLFYLPSQLVDMAITSPPYFRARDYKLPPLIWDGELNCKHKFQDFIREGNTWGIPNINVKSATVGATQVGAQYIEDQIQSVCKKCGAWKGSLGLEPYPDLFVKHLCDIFDQLKRVLRNDGSLFVVIGDTYGTAKVEDQKQQEAFLSRPAIPDLEKSLCLIPMRFGLEMINRGWTCRNVIIWHKPDAMPSSVKDRFTVDYEYVFFFTKEKQYYFKQQFEPLRKPKGKSVQAPKKFDQYGNPTYSGFEYDARDYPQGRNKRCVWSIHTAKYIGKHYAVYPEELLEIPIKACSREGGIVLDPFMGTGTTALVSKKLNRDYLGIELSQDYIKQARERLFYTGNNQQLMAGKNVKKLFQRKKP